MKWDVRYWNCDREVGVHFAVKIQRHERYGKDQMKGRSEDRKRERGRGNAILRESE